MTWPDKRRVCGPRHAERGAPGMDVAEVSGSLAGECRPHSHFAWARHNHCYTSPIYREKTALINRKLAERYQNHPALLDLACFERIRWRMPLRPVSGRLPTWLKERYGSLEALNQAWWTAFWSHTYTEWSQIESPVASWRMGNSRSQPRLETVCHASDDRLHEE